HRNQPGRAVLAGRGIPSALPGEARARVLSRDLSRTHGGRSAARGCPSRDAGRTFRDTSAMYHRPRERHMTRMHLRTAALAAVAVLAAGCTSSDAGTERSAPPAMEAVAAAPSQAAAPQTTTHAATVDSPAAGGAPASAEAPVITVYK